MTVFVVVAEWLRRWTRNPLGSPRAGSNPADYVNFPFFPPSFQRIEVFFSRFELATMIYTIFFLLKKIYIYIYIFLQLSTAGLQILTLSNYYLSSVI